MEAEGIGAATNSREAPDSRCGEEVAAATAGTAEAAMSAAAAVGALRLEAEGPRLLGPGQRPPLVNSAYDVFSKSFFFPFFLLFLYKNVFVLISEKLSPPGVD
jgi:hypothetical protein